MRRLNESLQGAGICLQTQLVNALTCALQTKRFVLLTGLSGSGKTLLAKSFAAWITPTQTTVDPFSPGATLAAARKIYMVNDSDRLGVEFLSDEGTKVLLPREIIEQWANYIEANGISETIGAQELRDKIKASGGKYSAYLQNFETHYKPAAYSMLKARAQGTPVKCWNVIAVGADWTSNENLLGYPDALKAMGYRKPDNGALDLILRAKNDPDNPYFLILDEMNLSHVERYFADFLSAMESGEAINLHDDTGADWDGVPAKLKIPDNLFVIGTVNVDETTYMFSPKVLDRANVIEFRVSNTEMGTFLSNPAKPDLAAITGAGKQYAHAFVAAARDKKVPLDEDTRKQVADVLMAFFPQLQEAGAEFGYRTAHEICRFVYFHKELSGNDWAFSGAMDAAIMQKLLPKLHGSKKKLGPVLTRLIRLCMKEEFRPKDEKEAVKEEFIKEGTAIYWNSLEKLGRMQKRLQENGFTSFAEA